MNLAQAMEQERERLNMEKDILAKEMETIKTAMAGLDKELRAISAYERAKNGAVTTTAKRRTGIRSEVKALIGDNANGIDRAQILEQLNAKGNKSAEQSVSNALGALKKAGKVTSDNGVYKTA